MRNYKLNGKLPFIAFVSFLLVVAMLMDAYLFSYGAWAGIAGLGLFAWGLSIDLRQRTYH